jgi:hypothetical protein
VLKEVKFLNLFKIKNPRYEPFLIDTAYPLWDSKLDLLRDLHSLEHYGYDRVVGKVKEAGL